MTNHCTTRWRGNYVRNDDVIWLLCAPTFRECELKIHPEQPSGIFLGLLSRIFGEYGITFALGQLLFCTSVFFSLFRFRGPASFKTKALGPWLKRTNISNSCCKTCIHRRLIMYTATFIVYCDCGQSSTSSLRNQYIYIKKKILLYILELSQKFDFQF